MSAGNKSDPVFAILALPEGTPLALHGLYEVFHCVGRTWAELTGEENTPFTINPIIVARSLDPIETTIGIEVKPQATLGPADVIIVADVAISNEFDPRGCWSEEIAWIKERYQKGAIVCSVCSGSLLLAEAGLLNGEVATTHWAANDMFRTYYPDVRLAPERILTTAGDSDRIVTGGGASSWEDLALYLVARFSSSEEAIRIAKIFLFGERSEGQLLYAAARRAKRHNDIVISDAQAWIAENYNDDKPVAKLVSKSGLRERTFNRRFRSATGYTPIEYVQTMRIEEAKHLLEMSDTPIETISNEVGYTDSTYFRRLFRRRTGVTPARYRQRFSVISKIVKR
ncbi:MAG: GlxA family transcriptional regulator [Rhizobiaceae bacterium]